MPSAYCPFVILITCQSTLSITLLTCNCGWDVSDLPVSLFCVFTTETCTYAWLTCIDKAVAEGAREPVWKRGRHPTRRHRYSTGHS